MHLKDVENASRACLQKGYFWLMGLVMGLANV